MITIVHVAENPFDIYIGRKTKSMPINSMYGNPFIIGVHGDRDEVLDKYALWILDNEIIMDRIEELKGKTLGCWCYPFQRCHGEILAEILGEQVLRK
jgi:hypothetical protein